MNLFASRSRDLYRRSRRSSLTQKWRSTYGYLTPFPQVLGPLLVAVTYEALYGRSPLSKVKGGLVVRDEGIGWVEKGPQKGPSDYYTVRFDQLAPSDDQDPETLQININDTDKDQGADANKYLLFAVDWKELTEKRVLAVPRCCQVRKGTTDRARINDGVQWRDQRGRTGQ